MLSKLSLSRKVLILTSLGLLIQLAFVLAVATLFQATEDQAKEGIQARRVIARISRVSILWSQIGAAFPNSIVFPDLAESLIGHKFVELETELKRLGSIVLSNRQQKDEVDELVSGIHAAAALEAQAEEALLSNNTTRFYELLDQVAQLSSKGAQRLNRLLEQCEYAQEMQNDLQNQLNCKLNTVFAIGLVINLCSVLLLSYLFMAEIARKTELLSGNIRRLAEGLTLHDPLPGDDEFARLDKTFRQMGAALSQSARKERAVVENTRDLIFTLDNAGMFLMLNPAARSIVGYEPEELVGRLLLDFVAPEDRSSTGALFEKLSKGSKTPRLECRLIAMSGDLVDIQLSAYWSTEDQCFFCVAHDITQRRVMERLKGQFVAMVRHDLASPSTSVLTTLRAITAGIYTASSEKGSIRIQESKQNIDRMLMLISDLLEMGRFDSASFTIDPKNTNLSAVVEESVGSVRSYAEEQNVAIKSQLVEAWVVADRLRLVQVLVNLLSNAIKFSPAGASISITTSINKSAMALVQVTDSGSGISEEDQEIIFEAYKQAKSDQWKQHAAGTGLGLTICKSIIQAHHGSIGVASAVPSGSTFWIEIPLAEEDQTA